MGLTGDRQDMKGARAGTPASPFGVCWSFNVYCVCQEFEKKKSCFYLLMPEITAVPRCQPQLCILLGRKSGCTCHYREVTQEVNQASVSVPWPIVIVSGPQQHVTTVNSFKKGGRGGGFHNKMHLTIFSSAAGMHVTRRMERDRGKIKPPEWGLDFLLVVYLFFYFCRISSLSQRSEVRRRNVFPPNEEKHVQLVQCRLGHGSSCFWTMLHCFINTHSPLKVMLKGRITELLLSLVPHRSCSWPLPSFP